MRRLDPSSYLPAALLVLLLVPVQARAGEIRGRLLADDRPVPGVAVAAVPYESPFEEARRQARGTPAPTLIASAASGSDGTFALSVPAGTPQPGREFRIRLEKGGIVPSFVPGTFDAAEVEDLGDLSVVKAAQVAGRISTGDAAPSGAEVTLLPRRGREGDPEPIVQTVKAGADGVFAFDAASPAGNEVSVRANGFYSLPVPNAKGPLARPIPLLPAGAVFGIVKGSDRKTAAAGALVRFEGRTKTAWVECGADGTFRLGEVPPGAGLLVADGGEQGIAELTGAHASETQVTINLTSAARLEGRVVNALTGKPIPRAKVTATSPRGPLSTRSGADGRYVLRNVFPGRFNVRGDEPRHAPWERTGVVLGAGEVRKLDLPLTPGVTLSGRVVDENGAPVVGAKGSLGPATAGGLQSILRALVGQQETAFVTGVGGNFRAARLRPGDNLRLSVQHQGYEPGALAGLNLPPGTARTGLTVTLRQGLVLSGVVRDEKQEPVAGAEISLTQSRTFGNPRGGMVLNLAAAGAGRLQPEKSGADGVFAFRGLSPGDFDLQVRRSGYATESVGPVKLARGEAPKPVEVVLSPGAAITGTVKLKDGTPVADKIVTIRSPGRGPGQMMAGMNDPTGPDGLFVLEGLRPGSTYDLQVLDGMLPRPVRSGVPAPSDGVEIVLPSPGRITGTAVDAGSGKPITDFQVWYDTDRSTGQGGGGVFRFARGAQRQLGTGAGDKLVLHSDDGSFALENVPAGTWEVNLEAKGYQAARVGGIAVTEGAERPGVTVKVSQGVTLTGKVVDSQSGRGVPDVHVSTSPVGGSGGGAALRVAISALSPQGDSGPSTDADGAFTIDGLAMGKYTVTAKNPDYAEGSETAELKETGGVVKISLSSGSHISGVVVDAGNQPLPGAQVALMAASDGGFMGRGGLASEGTTADQAGAFRFDHLAAGRYTVTASLRNVSSSQQRVVLAAGQSQDGVVISLAGGATVQGVVTGLPDAQRGNVLISASGADGFGGSARTGAGGSFEISGVPEGTLMLRATAGDIITSSRTTTTEVQIPAGQAVVQAEVAFDPAGFAISGTVTRGGQPVAGGLVMVNSRGGAGLNFSGQTDDGGRYRIEGVKNGTYGVAFRDLVGGASVNRTVSVTGDTTVDLDVPQGRITGIVTEAGSRLPLSDAAVSASPAPGGSGATATPGGGMGRSASTDSNGEFSLESLNPASYSVVARRSGYIFQPKSVTVTGSDAQDVALEGTRSDGIGIQASDGILGVPLRSLMARVRGAGGTAFIRSVSLDGNGRGEIPSVPPGTYTVTVEASGYAPAVLPNVAVPSPTIPVGLTPGGTVEIHAGPKTLAPGSVQGNLLTSGGVPYPATPFGPEGRVNLSFEVQKLPNIAPGSYTLTLAGGDSRTFSVQEGGVAVVSFP